MQLILRTAIAVVFLSSALWADFSYKETTNITGGSMASAMKMAGKMGGQSLDNQVNHVFVQGDRMAQINETTATVIDLAAETITNIHYKKREFSVTTFAEMRAAIAQAQEKLAKKKKGGEVEMSFDVDVQDPGRTETINGVSAKEMILIVKANFETDKQAKGAMNMATNMWLADIDGSEEVKNFHLAMAEKLDWTPGAGAFAGMAQGFNMGESMAEMQEKMAQLDGYPVKQVMRMGADVEGMEALAEQDQQEVAAAQQQRKDDQPSMKEALKGLGGFGGFGRKKKKEKEPEPAPAASNGAMTAADAGVMMEITMTQADFSTAAISADKFATPSSFKQVESGMAKAIR